MIKNKSIKYINIFLAMSCVILMTALMIFPSVTCILADEQTEKSYVIDDADILDSDEEQKLEKLCKKTSERCNIDIVIITMKQNLDYAPMDNYLRSILEQQYGYYGTGTNCEAVVYGIDMLSRADRIVTSGKARSDITQTDLDDIRELAESDLADGYYYSGCKEYVKGIERQLNTSLWFRLTYDMWIKVIIAAVLAFISVIIMMFSAKAKMTVSSTEYTKNHNYNIRDRKDIFINTTVTTRHIENNSSSGGGSSSSGGGGNSGSSGGHF